MNYSLDRLSDKLNVLVHNIRELLFKFSLWDITNEPTITFKLLVEDAPTFEEFTIPSKVGMSNGLTVNNDGSVSQIEKTTNYLAIADKTFNSTSDEKYQFIIFNGSSNFKFILGESLENHFFEFVFDVRSLVVGKYITIYGIDESNPLLKILTKENSYNLHVKFQYILSVDGVYKWVLSDLVTW